MEQQLQCPVCTLFLHGGISLENHLDTHPKDQVIKALCTLSGARSNYGSRSTTPMHSERSYRSRSRTPAVDESRWNSPHTDVDRDRYWPRSLSRSSRPAPSLRTNTPSDLKIGDINFEHSNMGSGPVMCANDFSNKTANSYTPDVHNSDLDHHYVYIQEQPEETEMKYSRSAEYNSYNNANNMFTYNMQVPPPSGVRLQTSLVPAVSKRHSDFVNIIPSNKRGSDFIKLVPKPGNIAYVKTNVGSVQYITPNVKPMHVMMPSAKTFMQSQQNTQNNIIMSSNAAATQTTKPATTSILSNQFGQISSASFTPNTTVVTQNSQIIYREMVHNIDGKPFISTMPTMLNNEDMTNVSQQNSLYQNVMVVDPYGATSCMYTPQPLLPQVTGSSTFNTSLTVTTSHKNNNSKVMEFNEKNDTNKNLIIEVSPIISQPPESSNEPSTSNGPIRPEQAVEQRSKETITSMDGNSPEKSDNQSETSITKKGLKILSNIKVEVPVQHHKSLLNTVVDLTGNVEQEFPEATHTADHCSFENRAQTMANSYNVIPTTSNDDPTHVANTFSVIKNVGNPSNKDQKCNSMDNNRINEVDSSDSCPVPDLICNEKPSISPCSELSESRENSTDHTSISFQTNVTENKQNNELQLTRSEKKSPKTYRNNPLKLNNIFVKKHKKVLQIKNAKTCLPGNTSRKSEVLAVPSTSTSKWPETFTHSKLQQNSFKVEFETREIEPYLTANVKTIHEHQDQNNFDADTEEQSMDIEPVTPSSICYKNQFQSGTDVVHVKDEMSGSNENFSINLDANRDLTQLEPVRPVNVIAYGNMSSDNEGDRDLLELEAASKTKHFVNMMTENYFGDNFYADYFTPDRVEAFDAVRDANYSKDQQKDERCDGVYLWGEPSQKDYIIPNFIHDSYKIAESATCSNYTLNTEGVLEEVELDGADRELEVEGDACERDSKADVLSESRSESEIALDISADERMPPRGELSGQESNGDMDAPWTGQEVASSASYDLIARETWMSDGSEVDVAEKQDNLEEEMPVKTRSYQCSLCGDRYPSIGELRAHRLSEHPPGGGTYCLLSARAIKKEKSEPNTLADAKAVLATSILGNYEEVTEAKPKVETGIVKQEVKRRRRDYVCHICKVDQHNDVQFHAHLKIHPLECLTCGKCFFKRANLALHIRIHLGIKNYKCEVCEKRFLTKNKLQEHHNIHTGRSPVKCTLCDETFRRHSNMIQHRDRHHLHKKKKIRDFVCQQCGEVFHSRRKLLWHRETHEEKPRACPYCSDKFVHSASLTRHVRRAHNAYYVPDDRRSIENVPCPICKQIYLKTNIEVHMKTHAGKKPYQCVICNKNFTTKWNLKLHRWTHMSRSSKPYKCSLCKGAFIRQNEYISHMNAHKSVRPYTCNYCGCQFIRKYNCQRHVREHENAKRYVCKVAECGKSFHRSYYLTEHMRVHSGARPFACSICGKTSSNKSNHNKHVKIHHTREPVATEA